MNDEPKIEQVPEDDHQPATKGDVRSAVDELAQATNKGFEEMREFIKQQSKETHEYIRQENQQTRDHLTALIKEVREDVGGANRDEVTLIKDQKLPELDRRVTTLERRAGVA